MVMSDVQRVFTAWAERRPKPQYCKLSKARKRLITARLKEYSADELVAVIRYAYDADEPWPRWMRGNNPRDRQYLDLENLFRVTRLAERVEEALLWADRMKREGPAPKAVDGVVLGPMGDLLRGPWGEA
jgi:hypothetical protein